jgi:hypothetical protein
VADVIEPALEEGVARAERTGLGGLVALLSSSPYSSRRKSPAHRDPGLIGYLLATHLPVGFMGDGYHLAFETVRLLARIKAPDELVLVTDALAGLGMPPGRYQLAEGEYVSDETCGRLPDGTLAGSLLQLNRAVGNLVERVGLAPSLAVQPATLNPVRVLGLDGSLGRIEVGRYADLTLVDERWEVQATLVDVLVAYSSGSVKGPDLGWGQRAGAGMTRVVPCSEPLPRPATRPARERPTRTPAEGPKRQGANERRDQV